MRDVIALADKLSESLSSVSSNGNLLKNLKKRGGFTAENVKRLNQIAQILEEIFPSMWDIKFGVAATMKIHRNTYGSNHAQTIEVFDRFTISNPNVVIRFPEFYIKNSRGEKGKIRDLFVRFSIEMVNNRNSTFLIGHPEGMRLTLNPAEYEKGYYHSHLTGPNLSDRDDGKELQLQFMNFCLGHGDIRNVMSLLAGNYDPEMFRLFLLQLDTYVKWESIEGGPYRQIATISLESFDLGQVTSDDVSTYYRKFLLGFQRSRTHVNLNWKITSNDVKLVWNEELERFILETIKVYSSTPPTVYKNEKGDYFKSRVWNPTSVNEDGKIYYFRGQQLRFNVVPDGIEIARAEAQKEKFIHPKITEYVKRQLELTAKNSLITQSRVNK